MRSKKISGGEVTEDVLTFHLCRCVSVAGARKDMYMRLYRAPSDYRSFSMGTEFSAWKVVLGNSMPERHHGEIGAWSTV
jgi:hypothetical protein